MRSCINLSQTKCGKYSSSSQHLQTTQLLPLHRQAPTNCNKPPKVRGKSCIIKTLSSVRPKACISPNLMNSRRISSGCSDNNGVTCRNKPVSTRVCLVSLLPCRSSSKWWDGPHPCVRCTSRETCLSILLIYIPLHRAAPKIFR